MAQQLINIGTVANDRTGDTWRNSFDKSNQNFTELYGLQGANPIIYVAEEADFPVQDATTITLEAGKIYQYTASFSTAKKFTVNDGAKLTAFNFFSPILTYTGTGSMFTGTDASFTIRECRIDCPNAQAFSFTDTVGGTFLFLMYDMRIVSAAKFGTFNNMQTVLISGSSSLDMDDGISLTGANMVIFSISKLFLGSTSATFEGVDFGTTVSQTIEIDDFIPIGPTGSIGIKGAASSANIPVGNLATVAGCDFSGVDTPVIGIVVSDDVRWRFTGNAGVSDTMIDCLLSLTSNATATTISTISTPVLIAGTWVIEDESLMTCTTAGRATFKSEVVRRLPVSAVLDVEPASGTNKLIKVYLYKNGTKITASGRQVKADAANPLNVALSWQLDLAENDYLELYVENNTDTIDILVSGAVLRVN